MMRTAFLERSIVSLRSVVERSVYHESIARRAGLLQGLDPRAKLAGMLALLLAAVIARDLAVLLALLALAGALAAMLGRSAFSFLSRAWLTAVAVSGAFAVPALIWVQGAAVAQLPFGLSVTQQGARAAAILLTRSVTATTLSLVLVLSTRWSELLRALRRAGVPALAIAIISMTYRYVFVLLEAAGESFDALRSRRVGRLTGRGERALSGVIAGTLMTRTLALTDEVYLAMLSRGFRGDVYALREARMRARDWVAAAVLVFVAIAAVAVGR